MTLLRFGYAGVADDGECENDADGAGGADGAAYTDDGDNGGGRAITTMPMMSAKPAQW